MSKKSKLKLKRANNSSKSGTPPVTALEMASGDKAVEPTMEASKSKGACCLPFGFDCLCPQVELKGNANEIIKMTCSSDSCNLPKLTHPRCFTKLESSAVVALRNVRGRAREWSDKERLRYLWQDRGYELIFKMFQCPCGHGYLRKGGNLAIVDGAAAGSPVDVKKKKKCDLPKLNVPTSCLSQKGVGQYFKDANCAQARKKTRKISEDSLKSEPSSSYIPGLSREGQGPQRLDIDLEAFKNSDTFKVKKEMSKTMKQQSLISAASKSRAVAASKASVSSSIIPLANRFQFGPPEMQSNESCSDMHSCSSNPVDLDIFESDDEGSCHLNEDFDRAVGSPVAKKENDNREMKIASPNLEMMKVENVELLQQNVCLRDENVKLKQILLDERKQAFEVIQFQLMESQQKDTELLRLQEQLKNEGVLNNVLRDLLLQPSSSPSLSASEAESSLKQSPSRNLDDVDYHGSGENSSNTTGHETPVTDFSDSGVSENEVLQVNQRLEELDFASRNIVSLQNKTDDKIVDLNFKMSELAKENLQFRKDIEKLRNYLKFFDLF